MSPKNRITGFASWIIGTIWTVQSNVDHLKLPEKRSWLKDISSNRKDGRCLPKRDTYMQGEGSTIARVTDGSLFPHPLTAIAGVANIGDDPNWCGHPFAQANWYAFGRLAWKHSLSSEQIGEESVIIGRHPVGTGTGNIAPRFRSVMMPPGKNMMLSTRYNQFWMSSLWIYAADSSNWYQPLHKYRERQCISHYHKEFGWQKGKNHIVQSLHAMDIFRWGPPYGFTK